MYFIFYSFCVMLQSSPGNRQQYFKGKEALIMKKLSKLVTELYESFSHREG